MKKTDSAATSPQTDPLRAAQADSKGPRAADGQRAAGHGLSRRDFLASSAAAAATFTIVPRHVLGGAGQTPPSEQIRAALIGCGGRSSGTFGLLGKNAVKVAECDVRFKDKADNKTIYTDFRRVLERDDIDVVAIATHPGWHALISIAAMEAGKDVLCEKPLCRFISEGRAIADAEKRTGRIFQIENKGAPGKSKLRKILHHGLVGNKFDRTAIIRGAFKLEQWHGRMEYDLAAPKGLDWDMYCGPAPMRPLNGHRVGGSHRGYWDYDGGGLGDMATHHLWGPACGLGRDLSCPVEAIPYAPPQHPEAAGMWGWCEIKFADGFKMVLESTEWGKPYEKPANPADSDEKYLLGLLSPEQLKQLDSLPDAPGGEPPFLEAIRTRQRAGGHAERAHKVTMIFHMANLAFRCGRTVRMDPVTEQIIGDEEANRLVNQPMRAPWRL